jgi:hypothetical protein
MIAKTTVDRLIRTAPNTGLRIIPTHTNTPTASGIAMTSQPAAYHRFWTIFR